MASSFQHAENLAKAYTQNDALNGQKVELVIQLRFWESNSSDASWRQCWSSICSERVDIYNTYNIKIHICLTWKQQPKTGTRFPLKQLKLKMTGQ
jgi:hypothetical protein